jgi:uncharacterized membrane protein
MIQRIQTIYLLLVTLICVSAAFIPATYLSVDFKSTMDQGEFHAEIGLVQQTETSSAGLMEYHDSKKLIALELIGALALFCVFLYKDRTKQMRFVRLNIIMSLIFLIGMAYFSYNYIQPDKMMEVTAYSIKPLGLVVMALIILLNTLALIQIRKDDNKVKSADRFR